MGVSTLLPAINNFSHKKLHFVASLSAAKRLVQNLIVTTVCSVNHHAILNLNEKSTPVCSSISSASGPHYVHLIHAPTTIKS